MTRGDLAEAAESWARAARTAGIGAGDRVAVPGATHRDVVAAVLAVTGLGADVVLLPPDLPAHRLAELEATLQLRPLPTSDARQVSGSHPRRTHPAPLARPTRPGTVTVMTSGTTGTPRPVARRPSLRQLAGPVATHLRLIPIRAGEPLVLAAPIHHGYGLSYLAAGLTLGAPVILAAGSPARSVVDAVREHAATVLVLLPIQLRRLVELPDEALASLDGGPLRAVVCGGAPVSPTLLARARDVLGDRIFNLYGTSEAGWAAIATPADLRAAPGTVGRPPHGIDLRIVDRAGWPLPPGPTGEVHLRGWQADGGWAATGDLGHLDLAGRLHLDGRVDDMIVSAGENPYPATPAAGAAGLRAAGSNGGRRADSPPGAGRDSAPAAGS